MFVFGINEMYFLDKDEKETKTFSIGDLFDVFNGVIEDRHLPIVAETNSDIIFIHINSFSESNILLGKQELYKIQQMQLKRKETLGKNTNDRKPLSEKKVLTKEDYIIYTRGLPRGFSMQHAPIGNGLNVVATHQFICLRPRTKLMEVHLPYLHLVLELFVKNYLKELFDLKQKTLGDKYSVFNSVSIKEIRDFELNILKSVSSQKKLYDAYSQLKQNYAEAAINLNSITKLVYNNIYLEKVW